MASRSVRDEIKQTRPFRTRAQEVVVALFRTANMVRKPFEALFANEGITFQQYNVLRILRGARAPLPTMEIAERMIEDTPGITRLVNVLDERGLIRREQWPGDRRQTLCQITPAGLRILEDLDPPVDALDDAAASALTDDELETLLQLLGRVREATGRS